VRYYGFYMLGLYSPYIMFNTMVCFAVAGVEDV
jgi:hypothetical protein